VYGEARKTSSVLFFFLFPRLRRSRWACRCPMHENDRYLVTLRFRNELDKYTNFIRHLSHIPSCDSIFRSIPACRVNALILVIAIHDKLCLWIRGLYMERNCVTVVYRTHAPARTRIYAICVNAWWIRCVSINDRSCILVREILRVYSSTSISTRIFSIFRNDLVDLQIESQIISVSERQLYRCSLYRFSWS